MKVYQIAVMGKLALFQSTSKVIYSKTVYRDRGMAEDNIDAFILVCQTPLKDSDMMYLSDIMEVRILELDVV